MNDRRPYSLLQIRELGHGIHDLPGFDTNDFRSFAVRLDPHETRLPIDRSAETLLLVVEGSLTVVWRGANRVSTELGEGGTASTNPRPSTCCRRAPRAPHSSRWRAGLGSSDGSCVMKLSVCKLQVASNNSLWFKEAEYVQDNPDHRHQQRLWA